MTNQRCLINDVVDRIRTILKGKIPEKIDQQMITDEKELGLVESVNLLIEFVSEIDHFISPLARGELRDIRIQPKNFMGSPFKELHSHLIHLTWQAKQVTQGDYNQRVDFMGDFSEAFNTMVVSLDTKEKALKQKIQELEEALTVIKRLEGILPICSFCKKIRPEGVNPKDQNGWVIMEQYIQDRSEAKFSHSICPECRGKNYPDIK
jgi:hypothetical protein